MEVCEECGAKRDLEVFEPDPYDQSKLPKWDQLTKVVLCRSCMFAPIPNKTDPLYYEKFFIEEDGTLIIARNENFYR